MSKPIITVNSLSKRYRIGIKHEKERNIREDILNLIKAPIKNLRRLKQLTNFEGENGNNGADILWALKDVSFEVNQGEVVGIIGRNGSGKSTLLKILSRITEPTEGYVEIRGRVVSLLEVGTGFHRELTGRENIYLNGSILGMRKGEIDKKLDEIVAFSEIEKFLDTPVKHYSSGMYVRLAFAVAAHLEPEILLVDEVLAVGDAVFQKKCLGKMSEVAKEGRTVLFVSHHMPSVLRLCERIILLKEGSISANGPAQIVADNYIANGKSTGADIKWNFDEAPGNEIVKIKSVLIRNARNEISGNHYLSDSITLEMEFWCLNSDVRINPSFHVYNNHSVCVFATSNLEDPSWGAKQYERGRYRSQCVIPGRLLNEGQYRVSAFVVKDSSIILVQKEEIVSFHAHDDETGRGDYTGGWIGVIRPILQWKVEQIRGEM